MNKTIQLSIPPERLNDTAFIKARVAKKARLKGEFNIHIAKRSIDARMRPPQLQLTIDILDKTKMQIAFDKIQYQQLPNNAPHVIIVGAGPAGYFAALRLIEHGIKPIIFERGKDVRARRVDLRAIQQDGVVNPDSNYCFGEGGAGTYSDGKLYTRATKRGDLKRILNILIQHGAKDDIMVDAHPHIGSNKLPNIISEIRENILRCGGEVHFNSKVTDFLINGNAITGVEVNGKDEHQAESVILATGHSARDIFELLHKKQIKIEAKPFALGVRVEHLQPEIDAIQYGQKERSEFLPASRYSLACQVGDRGVYSFCMCPGGFIVPASTSAGELVINGMSLSRRDSPFANSGVVTSIELEDIPEYTEKYGELACMRFQQDVEKAMFIAGGDETQRAPAQRMQDFLADRVSQTLPKTSYIPNIISQPLHSLLPEFVVPRLKAAFLQFDAKMKGYINENVTIVAVESRTSSPVKIPRNPETLEHIGIANFYPAAEGAGYAGGIISAAMDGERVANAIAIKRNLVKSTNMSN
jgi:hypothetical protein